MVEIVVDYLGKLVIIFLGELDGLLYALVIFVVLDYITGICAAIQAKHLSSNIGAKGIAKKVAIFLVISVAHVADQYLVDSTDVLRSMTTLFYLSNEGISIFENIGKIGIPLPGKLNNLLSRFEEPLSLQKLVTAAFASYIRIFFKNGIFAINIAAQNEITTVRLISKLRS